MTAILTLVAAEGDSLADHRIAAAARALEAAGAALGTLHWLAPGRAADLPFGGLAPEAAHRAAAATLADLPLDFHAQPAANRRKRLLLSDMDSTILTNETLDELADFAGMKDRIAAITARSMAGEIDFAAALIERVAMLADLPEDALGKTAAGMTYSSGAMTLVRTMRRHGAYTALVSGGFRYFTGLVAREVGFDLDLANELEIAEGRLTGRLVGAILDQNGKANALNHLAVERGLTPADAVTVGDGSNDLAMLRAAGLGVAYRGKPILRREIRCQVNHADLTALLYFQGYARDEFVA